jgi:methionine-rich copper-binding protein CopC
MKVAEYDEIHSDRNRYSILHDHELADGEYVVEVRALFDVVSKDGHSSEND